MQINDRKNEDVESIDPVENAIREPARDCSPYLAIDDLILHRVYADAVEKSVDLLHERTAKARTLPFVPSCRPPNIRFCCTPDGQPVGRKSRRMSSRAVSQVSTSPGRVSCS